MNKQRMIQINKEKNILKVVKLFLENDLYINEIAELSNISSSSVQRYLNDPLVCDLFGSKTKEQIKTKLKAKKISGNIKGGRNYSLNNTAIKNIDGKFNGSIKKS